MGILMKKVFRDLRTNKGRSISIIFIIMLATGLYFGLFLMYHNTVGSFDLLEEDSKIESVRFRVSNYVNLNDLSFDYSEITAWDYRVAEITNLKISENDDSSFTAPIFGIPGDRIPRVNYFKIIEGEYFSGSNVSEVIMLKNFMDKNELVIGDKVFLNTPQGSKEMTIVAQVASSEYLYAVNPISGLPDLTGLATAWIPLDYVSWMYSSQDMVNEVLFRFDDNTLDDEELYDAVIHKIKQDLLDLTPVVSSYKLEEEAEQIMQEADLGVVDEMAYVFSLLILLLGLFIMYDNISKLIASQRNYIGTMRALGGSKTTVVKHYTMLSAILGVIGVTLGIPFGFMISYEMTVFYTDLLGIPAIATDFFFEPFIEAVVINLSLTLIIGFLTALNASRIDPREAMASSFITMVFSKKSILEKVFSKIPGLRSPSMAIPIRTLFRVKRKTILTILTFSISLVLMISSLAFMDSFSYALNDSYDNYLIYDMEVHFYLPMEIQDVLTITKKMDGISQVEGFASTFTELSKNNVNKSVAIYGINPDSDLRILKLDAGDNDGLVLGKILADKLNVTVGDTVKLLNETVVIEGIAAELLADGAFLPLNQFQDKFNITNLITGIYVEFGDNADALELKNTINDSDLPIQIVILSEEVKEGINIMIQGIMGMIGIMVLLGFATIAIFSFNTIVLDVMARENEFVNLRSLGADKKKIRKMIFFQGIIITIIGSALAIPIGYIASDAVLQSLMKDLMVMDTVVYPQSYAIAIISAFLASSIGIFSAIKRVMKIDLVNALRTRMAN